ncbi:uncharacterized protein LOC142663753 [Rhinoderma darwinii]|uniref:uncharacterized protein LOC142663753 n=1 Tax=Rhinoderma darwinii TaxID=43563 RepID=UPI003F667347
MDENRERNGKKNAKHEDKINIIDEDAPHRLAEKSDVIEDSQISMPGSDHVTNNISPEDVDTSDIITNDAPPGLAEKSDVIEDNKISMSETNDVTMNTSPEDVETSDIMTDNVPQGLAEKSDTTEDTQISMPGSNHVTMNISPDHVDTSSDKNQEDKERLHHLPNADEHLGQNKEEAGFNVSKNYTPTDTASYSSPRQQLHEHLLAYFQKRNASAESQS